MELRNVFLVLLWLALAPLPDEASSPSPAWTPPVEKDQSIVQLLDHAHSPAERLHERWLPNVAQHWQRSRELAVDMICDLGVMALALVDCAEFSALDPAPVTSAPQPVGAGGSSGEIAVPDFNDIRRRSIEERMHSI